MALHETICTTLGCLSQVPSWGRECSYAGQASSRTSQAWSVAACSTQELETPDAKASCATVSSMLADGLASMHSSSSTIQHSDAVDTALELLFSICLEVVSANRTARQVSCWASWVSTTDGCVSKTWYLHADWVLLAMASQRARVVVSKTGWCSFTAVSSCNSLSKRTLARSCLVKELDWSSTAAELPSQTLHKLKNFLSAGLLKAHVVHGSSPLLKPVGSNATK